MKKGLPLLLAISGLVTALVTRRRWRRRRAWVGLHLVDGRLVIPERDSAEESELRLLAGDVIRALLAVPVAADATSHRRNGRASGSGAGERRPTE